MRWLIKGYQIDAIVRQHLWTGGFDYFGVATGHGVTHGLGVVEGGATISSMRSADQIALREGMIMTIGIRVPLITNERTWGLSPFDVGYTIRKCVCRHGVRSPTLYTLASDVGPTAKVPEAGEVGLYPVSKEHDSR